MKLLLRRGVWWRDNQIFVANKCFHFFIGCSEISSTKESIYILLSVANRSKFKNFLKRFICCVFLRRFEYNFSFEFCKAFVSNFFRCGSTWSHLVSDMSCLFMVVRVQFILQSVDMCIRSQ